MRRRGRAVADTFRAREAIPSADGMPGGATHTRIALALLWIAVAAANVSKPIHIDDPIFLGIAKQIQADPLHPMSGRLVLSGARVPISDTHEPHLVLYGYAALLSAFGESELALHLFHASFAALAIAVFFALARRASEANALLLTASFALGPAFLPAQNLMMDVPLVAAWLAVFWLLIAKLDPPDGQRGFALAALVFAAACLVKYTTLAIAPLLLLPIVLRRAWRWAWALVLPALLLGGWALFNWLDYGESHLWSRPRPAIRLAEAALRLVDWLRALGAVAPFSILGLPWVLASRRRTFALGAIAAGAAALPPGAGLEGAGAVLARLFLANGVLVLVFAAVSLERLRRERLEEALLLGGWIAAGAAFIVLFTPFMAVRHVLLVVPASLLALVRLLPPGASRGWMRAGFAASSALGLALASADREAAAFYRDQARALRERLGHERRVFYLGDWGFAWYAERAGMRPYLFGETRLGPGDRLVVASGTVGGLTNLAARQDAPRLVAGVSAPPGPRARLRTVRPWDRGGGYYAFRHPGLPWTLEAGPQDRFLVLAPAGEEGARP
jgi:hypothetical protein